MICFELPINFSSKQIIKKEMMEPNVLKKSQPLLSQSFDQQQIRISHILIPSSFSLPMKHFKFFIGKETFSIVSRPIRDTSPWDFSIMTLVIHNVFHNLFIITVIQLKTLQLLTYVIHRKNGYLWHVIAYHLEYG